MEKKRYGYLGPEGTFSEMAALKYSNKVDKIIPYKTIREVVRKIFQGEIDKGIIPLENSQEGSVNISQDLLFKNSQLKIQGEVIISVEHFLLAAPGIEIDDIEEIYSHPQAIAQSADFVYRILPRVNMNYTDSTASAADIVLDKKNCAMIGSRRIVELYPLEILAKNLQGDIENHTRFIVVGDKNKMGPIEYDPQTEYKTSIICAPEYNHPGVLHKILGEFATRGIDLTRIESRPTKNRLGEYLFYIDLAGHRKQAALSEALKNVNKICGLFMVPGSYPCDNTIDERRNKDNE